MNYFNCISNAIKPFSLHAHTHTNTRANTHTHTHILCTEDGYHVVPRRNFGLRPR